MPRVNLAPLTHEIHAIIAEAAVCSQNNDVTRLFETAAVASYARACLHMVGAVVLRAPKCAGCFVDDSHTHVECPVIDINALLVLDKHLALVVRGARFNHTVINDPRFKGIQEQTKKIMNMFKMYSNICTAIQKREVLGVRVALAEYALLFVDEF